MRASSSWCARREPDRPWPAVSRPIAAANDELPPAAPGAPAPRSRARGRSCGFATCDARPALDRAAELTVAKPGGTRPGRMRARGNGTARCAVEATACDRGSPPPDPAAPRGSPPRTPRRGENPRTRDTPPPAPAAAPRGDRAGDDDRRCAFAATDAAPAAAPAAAALLKMAAGSADCKNALSAAWSYLYTSWDRLDRGRSCGDDTGALAARGGDDPCCAAKLLVHSASPTMDGPSVPPAADPPLPRPPPARLVPGATPPPPPAALRSTLDLRRRRW